jgi:hypothetical protein
MNKSQGFVALILVLSLAAVLSALFYMYIESSAYVLVHKRQYYIHETERLVTRTCRQLAEEKVRAGVPADGFGSIRFEEKLFGVEVFCTVSAVTLYQSTGIKGSDDYVPQSLDIHLPLGFEPYDFLYKVQIETHTVLEGATLTTQSVVGVYSCSGSLFQKRVWIVDNRSLIFS